MGKRARIGLFAGAMAVAVTGRGCVTTPPPVAESVVAGASTPSAHSSSSLTSGDATAPDVSASPAPPPPAQTPPAQTPPPRAPQTPDERRAALDKQLDDSLGAFDARLHKEQQKIAEERDARQATVSAATTAAMADGGSGSPTAAGATTAGTATPGAAAAGTSSADGGGSSTGNGADGSSATEVPGPHRGKRGETRSSRAGDLKSDKGPEGPSSASGNGAPATIIPDGNDDDIVARRLRKAAELETDPELKEKLWKEYVEYKKNTQVR